MPRKKKPTIKGTGIPVPAETEIGLDAGANNNRAISHAGAWNKDNYMTYEENADDLVKRKGLNVYDYMLTDDQVQANAQLKKISRLATDWSIQAASADDRDQEIADFIRYVLNDQLRHSVRKILYSILTAMDYGYSITEKVYEYITEGRWKGRVGYRNLCPKDPKGYLFDRDEYGNLKPDGLVLNTGNINGYMVSSDKLENYPHLPIDKFVIFSYMSKFQNPYGHSDLRSGYRSWISKDVAMKLWMIYLERNGAPVPMAEIPPAATEDEVTDIRAILAGLQTRASITYPENFKLGFLESERTAAPGFERAISIHNGAISRSSNIPEMMGFYGGPSTTGSYGTSKVQYDIFVMFEEFLGFEIEDDIFHKQIIKPLVDLNYKNVEVYPRFKFSSIKRETRKDRAQILKLLAEAGIVYEIQPWMHNFVDLPIPQNLIPETGTPLHGQEAHDMKMKEAEAKLKQGDDLDLDREDRLMDPDERSLVSDLNPELD